ncbi:MAG: hypothetical protein WAR83_09960 [Flavobacteriales bacterium]
MNTATIPATSRTISELRSGLNTWLETLRCYREEIMIFEHRMEESVARGGLPEDELIKLEHLQNQFIRQTEVIDELRHDLKQHENTLDPEPDDRAIPRDHSIDIVQETLRDSMMTFEKLYVDLKAEFTEWLPTVDRN